MLNQQDLSLNVLQLHFQGGDGLQIGWIALMGFNDVMVNDLFVVSEGSIKELFHFGGTDCKDQWFRNSFRACTTHRRGPVCRTSILVYKQIYRQVIQPTDKETVCKLFNALHGG
jgi:hypothetical protein